MKHFGLFLDDNDVLRCRINNSILTMTEKNPILLPSKHVFVKLLITRAHQQVKHGGVNVTLSTLREQYWILKGRQVIKGILCKCVICKKLEGRPYDLPPSPDLPTCRVSDDPLFAHTGMDFAGLLYIKESTCLFMCASTCAIHLELTRGQFSTSI